MDNLIEAANRASATQSRDDALIRAVAQHGLTLPRNAVEWRVDSRKGTLNGLNLCVRLICTDGVVAWALTGDERTFFCHLSNFVEDKETRAEGREADKPRAKRGSKTVLAALESLLA